MDSKFYYFGPLLFHTKVNENDLKEIDALCHKNEDLNFRKHLAGHIDDEFRINHKKLEYILDLYFDDYKKCNQNFYGDYIDFYINSAWVNFMKPGDFNPLHTHNNCALSAVLFLSVPNEIKQEYYNFKKIRSNINTGPGELTFFALPEIKHFITEKSFFPNRGDLLIFPANLAHYVAPFKSNVERISVAFNMKIKD